MKASALLVSALLLLAGCSASAPGGTPGGVTGDESEPRMRVEQLTEGQQGPTERGITIADSARELREATGVRVPDSGEGLYICVHAGERPTGGYRVGISGGEDNKVRVTLREPGEGEIVTQALTSPYAVAVARGGVSAEELRFVDSGGESLGWPVDRP